MAGAIKPETTTCTCREKHPVNSCRSNGTPVALWKCPEHGNVFEDRTSGVTLDDFHENVFLELGDLAASTETIDTISRKLNRTTSSVRRAIDFLNSVGLTKTVIGEEA